MATSRDTTPTANEPVPTRSGSGPRLAVLPAVPRSVLTTGRASWRSVAEQRTVPLPPQLQAVLAEHADVNRRPLLAGHASACRGAIGCRPRLSRCPARRRIGYDAGPTWAADSHRPPGTRNMLRRNASRYGTHLAVKAPIHIG